MVVSEIFDMWDVAAIAHTIKWLFIQCVWVFCAHRWRQCLWHCLMGIMDVHSHPADGPPFADPDACNFHGGALWTTTKIRPAADGTCMACGPKGACVHVYKKNGPAGRVVSLRWRGRKFLLCCWTAEKSKLVFLIFYCLWPISTIIIMVRPWVMLHL